MKFWRSGMDAASSCKNSILFRSQLQYSRLEIDMEQLKLIRPTAAYAAQIAAYRQAFLDRGDSMDGTGSLARMEDPLDWLRQCEDLRHEETVPQGWVPSTQFICVRESDDKLVGMIQIRHRFNDFLEKYAGHIGYSVHPEERRKGCAKWMLDAVLPQCRKLGLEKVLVCCADRNPASRKTILANGGAYESTVYLPEDDEHLERYWIDTRLTIVSGYDRAGEILGLFSEYMDMLLDNDPGFASYLKIQNYDAEIRDLTQKYGLPDGRLYLALWNDEPAGCIALRRLDEKRCEMKRLYVRPEFRGKGIARQLVRRIIADANEIGYDAMLLDTLPFLQNAIRMYRALGFHDIPCYNDSPMENTVFLQLDL